MLWFGGEAVAIALVRHRCTFRDQTMMDGAPFGESLPRPASPPPAGAASARPPSLELESFGRSQIRSAGSAVAGRAPPASWFFVAAPAGDRR